MPLALGGRALFPPQDRHEVQATACSPRAELWGVRTHWAVRPLAAAVQAWGVVRRSISKSTVQRWLSTADLHPHRERRWLHSPDPQFREKLRRVVGWYTRRRRGWRVVCVDEKTQIQALAARRWAAQPGRPARVEATYRRLGTLALLAGFNIHTGQVVHLVRARHRHQEFLELLRAIRARWPQGRLVIILDNLTVHTTPAVRAWLRNQLGRVRFEFLPLHASWLNQIELWFSVLERQCLRRARVTQRNQLAQRIHRFVRWWNAHAHPFRWTFKGYPLQR